MTIPDEYRIPVYMQKALLDWIHHGKRPGSFLTAVLENNLMTAVCCADPTNVNLLKQYALYLYNETPGGPEGCHGSRQKVDAWERKFALLNKPADL